MRKLYSLQIELRVIRTLTLEPESKASQFLLSKLDQSHFATEVGRASFRRCLASLKKSSTLPYWEDLVSDPNLDEDIRDSLENCDFEALESKKRTQTAILRLNDYRKLRLLTKIGKQVENLVNSTDPVNVDDEIAEVQNTISEIRSSNKSFKVMRIGKNSNVLKSVKGLLKGESVEYIPTGFNGFDSINRGLARGSYMLVASPTGTGKSLMLSQLAENIANVGGKVGVVPLEMQNLEMLQRNIARVSKTDMTKIIDPINKLSKRQLREIYNDFATYDRKIARKGGAIEFYEFDEDISIENLTSTVLPFDLDTLIIDYIGLVEGAQGDDQWRALGNITRYLHVWSKSNNITSIGAAQLSDEGFIRYSKQMAEHAKYFWYWKKTDYSKNTGIFEVNQGKARQASDHSFLLKFDFAKMNVTDADKTDIEDFNSSKEDSKNGRQGSTKKKWKEDSSIGWEDEDVENIQPKPGPRAQKRSNTRSRRGGKSRPPSKEIEL